MTSVSKPRVSIFGIGYVGAVTAACICKDGFSVHAVDVNQAKADSLGKGISPIVEPGLPELLKGAVDDGLLTAGTSAVYAIDNTDLSIVCVGTPSLRNGNLDLSYVAAVAEDIGKAIGQKAGYHSVVMRSTMLPGSMDKTVIPILERASGKKAGVDFGIAYYPEFLREATAIADYENPAVIVLGIKDDETLSRLRVINSKLTSPEFLVDIKTAEAIKYANNTWHAVKISFANEIGNIAKAAGIDGHKVMEAVCADKRLNISTVYMKPGMAYGGSCLPKDLRALRYSARSMEVATPLLDAVADSNDNQIDRAFNMIAATGKKNVAMLGLSFKAGTDDLRESPLVEIAERLHGKGFKVKIYDENVRYSALTGANLSYVRAHLPHLADLLVASIEEAKEDADVLVVGNNDFRFGEAVGDKRDDQLVIDFVRVSKEVRSNNQDYAGLCW
ncbi:GDP-mannose 6-dehydrogenase [Asticcacaulis biprosthecium C19]|uniref:UDP-glucose 6-dehydrogenase n=1 Tax=Asticcacaulis biprosthecium C19 TaxID=715226 RepID=F4QTL5_9CAUL|nr:nucleotide sugar dehydrogenase [Asticcacaulis biprosthecium]EGF90085.1 GDP-mannose 6-dehydrogenase [Asticcacaulis biprosthecium C19]